jgi:TDG/mug DNA glycosylase family protein
VGLTPGQLRPEEFVTLPAYGIGLTDIAKYRSGRDAMLNDSDFDVRAFRRKLGKFQPHIAAFNGKKAAAVFFACETCNIEYGLQCDRVGQTALWVLPSTSGGARGFWDLKAWKALAKSLRELDRTRSGSDLPQNLSQNRSGAGA